MKYFYLYIFLLLLFIFCVSYWNTYWNSYKENFNSQKQNYILLGDSILKNDNYINDGNSVGNLLIERTNGKTTNLAADNSKIVDIYKQVTLIPDDLNSRSTTIFLSVGGNDILSDKDSTTLNTIFGAYRQLIKNIQNKSPNANLVLLDIYYPDNIKYKQYHTSINEWNNMLYDYGKQNNISILKISNVLTKPEDFTVEIEPSSIGSQKIVDTLLENY